MILFYSEQLSNGVTVYVGNVPGIDQTTLCGIDDIKPEAGGTISAIGCRCLVLGSVVTVDMEATAAKGGAVITRIAVFGLPKDGNAPLDEGIHPPDELFEKYEKSPCTY